MPVRSAAAGVFCGICPDAGIHAAVDDLYQ